MLNKGPLWKNIGKQDSAKQYQSSISSSGSRPIKTFHITFQDEKSSKNQSQIVKKNMNSPFSPAENSIIEQEELDVSPMIITEDRGSKRQRNEEVLQVISIGSYDNGKVTNMNDILSMDEINEQGFSDNNKILEESSSLPYKQRQKYTKDQPYSNDQRDKLTKAFNSIKLLKEELEIFRIYLADVFSNWEIQAIKTCKSIKDEMNDKISQISNQIKIIKPLTRNLQMEEWSKRYTVLQQQVLIVNKNFQLQKTNKETLKRENLDLQQRLRKIQRSQKQQRNKMGSQQTLAQELKTKIKRLQYQLSEIKLQSQSQLIKMSKLKQVIKQKEMYISSQGEELSQQQKKIKQLKILNQESSNRERRYQSQIKTLREKIQRQFQIKDKEISKGKMEIMKFKNLLKTSEEQLSQCQEYINKLNSQIKDIQTDKVKLQQKIRQNQGLYFKKLQQCDKYLIELENHVKEQTSTNEYRQQNFKSKEMQLFRIKQDFQNRMIELGNREYELQQIKKEFQQKTLYMQRRQEQMKYQYNNAIHAQNAVKDKWYERYYSILSPEKYKTNQMTPQRDINPLSPRSSLAQRRQVFDIPIRETKSPPRDKLLKVRSERNINTYRSDVPIVTTRNDFERVDSQKEIFNLGSRINSLRRELTKQLGQIGLNS